MQRFIQVNQIWSKRMLLTAYNFTEPAHCSNLGVRYKLVLKELGLAFSGIAEDCFGEE